jgi:hypothetical protein
MKDFDRQMGLAGFDVPVMALLPRKAERLQVAGRA